MSLRPAAAGPLRIPTMDPDFEDEPGTTQDARIDDEGGRRTPGAPRLLRRCGTASTAGRRRSITRQAGRHPARHRELLDRPGPRSKTPATATWSTPIPEQEDRTGSGLRAITTKPAR